MGFINGTKLREKVGVIVERLFYPLIIERGPKRRERTENSETLPWLQELNITVSSSFSPTHKFIKYFHVPISPTLPAP